MDDDRQTLVLASITKEKTRLSSDADATCAACQRVFSTTGNLTRHLKIGTVCRDWLDMCPPALHVWSGGSGMRGKKDMEEWEQERHHALDSDRPVPQDATDSFLTGTKVLECLLNSDTTCPFCHRTFSTIGCVNRHFKTSLVCDRWRATKLLELMEAVGPHPCTVLGRPTEFGHA